MDDLMIVNIVVSALLAVLTLPLLVPVFFLPIKMRITASGGDVSVFNLLGMKLRRSPSDLILGAHLSLIKEQDKLVHVRVIEIVYLKNQSIVKDSSQLVDLVSKYEPSELDAIMRNARTNKEGDRGSP